MKKRMVFAWLLILLMLLTGCGNVNSVQREIGESKHFSRLEIEEAMDLVLWQFAWKFDGCTLLKLEYDEEKTEAAAEAWARQCGEEEAIVLSSCFSVDETGGDGSLQPNSVYEGWQWILTRSGEDRWTLRTWGYG